MKEIILLITLIGLPNRTLAQFVRELREEEKIPKDELINYELKDIALLQEISTSKINGESKCLLKYPEWTDSFRHNPQTNSFIFWRNKTRLIEGKVNPEIQKDPAEGGARTGIWTFRYDDGKLFATGKYDSAGNKIGKWLFYYPSGELKKIIHYRFWDLTLVWDVDSNKHFLVQKSKLDEKYLEYYENGKLKVSGTYKSEVLWKDSAYVVSSQHYCEIPDTSLQRYTKGQIFVTRKTQKWLYYDEQGILVKEENYD
ncbi:MAG: hypothetical protein RLZZ628_963 [Bacteroidota bacterium]|jgi:hypothetical protein